MSLHLLINEKPWEFKDKANYQKRSCIDSDQTDLTSQR